MIVSARLDVVTVGRISVDLYADEPGAPFEGPQRFVKAVGGTAANVAAAAARLGHRAAVVTRVGDDPFGTYARNELDRLGVDTRFVGTHVGLPTPLAFAALTPPDDPALRFYRSPAAPDMQLTPDDLDPRTLSGASVFWVAGSALAEQPARATIEGWLSARRRAAHTVLDLDYRAQLWSSAAEAGATIGAAIGAATVVVGNRSECHVAVGTPEPEAAADRLLRRGVGLAVVKLGGEGVLVAWPDGREVIAPRPVDVVCGLGAGDAFGGALVHGLLCRWEPDRTVAYANAAGALVASRLMCSSAMPTADEIDELVRGAARGAAR